MSFRASFKQASKSSSGAIDLASIMVGIIVIGLIGGVIAATVFAVIPWAQDEAAKASLSSVNTAQSAYAGLTADGTELTSIVVASAPVIVESAATGISYATQDELAEAELLPESDKIAITLGTSQSCYVAMVKSDSGNYFWTGNGKGINDYEYEVTPNNASECPSTSLGNLYESINGIG